MCSNNIRPESIQRRAKQYIYIYMYIYIYILRMYIYMYSTCLSVAGHTQTRPFNRHRPSNRHTDKNTLTHNCSIDGQTRKNSLSISCCVFARLCFCLCLSLSVSGLCVYVCFCGVCVCVCACVWNRHMKERTGSTSSLSNWACTSCMYTSCSFR
jgi:hypothetical protein